MANPTIDALIAQVHASIKVESSAFLLLNGLAGRFQAAVEKVMQGSATAADLAPIQDEINALNASAKQLAEAVVANTALAPTPPAPAPAPAPAPVPTPSPVAPAQP